MNVNYVHFTFMLCNCSSMIFLQCLFIFLSSTRRRSMNLWMPYLIRNLVGSENWYELRPRNHISYCEPTDYPVRPPAPLSGQCPKLRASPFSNDFSLDGFCYISCIHSVRFIHSLIFNASTQVTLTIITYILFIILGPFRAST